MSEPRHTPGRRQGLRERRILIVEDEFVIAEDLAAYFAALGAEVVGPAGSLARAFSLAGTAEAAVLDITLAGETVFPLAEALFSREVPFVFFTAHAAVGVPPHLRGVARFVKPAAYARAAETLALRLDAPEVGPEDGEDDALVRLLPKLRIAARLLVRDGAAADRLVERALERAVEALPARDRSVPLEAWIVTIMRETADRDDRRSMT